jgi:DNA-binding NarL/FixJ family response regulator
MSLQRGKTEGYVATKHQRAVSADSSPNQELIKPLTETQLTILGLFADGLSNQAIADKRGSR